MVRAERVGRSLLGRVGLGVEGLWGSADGAALPVLTSLTSPGCVSQHHTVCFVPIVDFGYYSSFLSSPGSPGARAELTHAFPDFLTPCSRACLELQDTLLWGVAIPVRKPN